MADSILYIRDPKTAAFLPLKIHDNGDDTYTLPSVSIESTITLFSLTKGTGDLESGTSTIVPTSRPDTGSAQYSAALTLPAPSSALLAVTRIATRVLATIGTMGTATDLYLSVRVDVDNTDYEIFSEHWTTNGAKIDAIDLTSAVKPMAFALLKNGSAHTFYFMFWANAASQVTLTLVELQEQIGTCSSAAETPASPALSCLALTYTGRATWSFFGRDTGGGNISSAQFRPHDQNYLYLAAPTAPAAVTVRTPASGMVIIKNMDFCCLTTQATDICGIDYLVINLESD